MNHCRIRKELFSWVLVAALLFCSFCIVEVGNAQVSVVSAPELSAVNTNYLNNKSPLLQNAFIKLPVGSVKPMGWLNEYLVRQKNGLTGQLGKISAWLQKENNAWLSKDGKGEYGWEEVPYWLKGYANIGYILNDQSMITEAKIWLNAVLSSQRPDGDFGPTSVDKNGAEDFWPKMIMLYCLQSYYEYSRDASVIPFMQNFFRYQLNYPEDKFIKHYHYWQGWRTGDNLHSVLWLYNITGDSWLLELAKKIHRNSTSWENRNTVRNDKNLPGWFGLLPNWHNVNIAQGFREPATYYLLSGDKKDLRASYEVQEIARQYFGQVPGGMFGADENARPGHDDPQNGTETCGFVEQMNSDEQMFRMTGDIKWADHAENVAFNSYPAAVMPDFKSLRYITSPNMVLNDSKNHHPGIDNAGPFLMMNPFSSRCCQHNHSQGWPYYAENLWMATPDNGVAAALYAASAVNLKVAQGKDVRFTEITNYPFDEAIRIRFNAKEQVLFPLYLRIPAWAENAALWINGKKQPVKIEPSKFLRINRLWKNNDEIRLILPMKVTLTAWKQNKNSASVNYGPLTFSLKIDEKYIKAESDKTAIGDSKWQKGVNKEEWPSYEIRAASPWNYGLYLTAPSHLSGFKVMKKNWPKNNFPFTPDAAPIYIIAKGKQIPEWTIDANGLAGRLIQSPVKTSRPLKEITLIPMGAARLRISQFPVVQ